jgi:Na+-driven multidrug efflux pump
MIITNWLMVLEAHLECIFINLGYAQCATLNSLVNGLGVDVLATYFLIYKWDMGMYGAALAQLGVRVCRILFWLGLMQHYGLYSTICGFSSRERNDGTNSINDSSGCSTDGSRDSSDGNEALLCWKEVKEWINLTTPAIASNFSGWFIFEMQIMALANIDGITPAGIAAGAIWVQSESTIASVQTGWIQCTQMRTLNLLGRADQGAPYSYAIQSGMSFVLVLLSTTLPLLIWSNDLAAVVSNDLEVQDQFSKIVWVLALHSQTRICSINGSSLFIPLGKGTLGVLLPFFAFYLVASPISGTAVLTNLVTTDVPTKMVFAVGASSIAQVLITVMGFVYFLRLDWVKTGEVVRSRANTDTQQAKHTSNKSAVPLDAEGARGARSADLVSP